MARPAGLPPEQTPAGTPGFGNKVFLGTRHYGYANVMYLDGRVNRDGQMHIAYCNMDYDWATGQARSSQWRASCFASNINMAQVLGQVHIMPVLMVRGWEYFFDANGMKAR